MSRSTAATCGRTSCSVPNTLVPSRCSRAASSGRRRATTWWSTTLRRSVRSLCRYTMAGRILSCWCGRHTILNIDHSSLSSIYITSTTNSQTYAANPPSISSTSYPPSYTKQPPSFTRRPPFFRAIPLWFRFAITSLRSHVSSFSSFSTSSPSLLTILLPQLAQPIFSKPILPFI